MRAIVFFVCLCMATSVIAEELSTVVVKPISELDFYKKVIQAKRKVKLSGTQLQRQEQWKEFLSQWNTEFSSTEIELDGIVTNVAWYDGWASVMYDTKTPATFRKAAQLVSDRKLIFRCDKDRIRSVEVGDKIHIRATLSWKPGIFADDPGPSSGAVPVRFYRHADDRFLQGQFLATKVEMVRGKEVFSYVATKGKK